MPIPKLSVDSMIAQANTPAPVPPPVMAPPPPPVDPYALTPLDVAAAQQLYITQPKSMSTPPPMPPPQKGWKR